jgi:hypothetical protein
MKKCVDKNEVVTVIVSGCRKFVVNRFIVKIKQIVCIKSVNCGTITNLSVLLKIIKRFISIININWIKNKTITNMKKFYIKFLLLLFLEYNLMQFFFFSTSYNDEFNWALPNNTENG